jgi:hypothetical protein
LKLITFMDILEERTMNEMGSRRTDLIIAGLGGQGILMGGMILAIAAMNDYKNSLWLPSYSSRVRGGPSECTVVFSDDDIDSPLSLLILLNSSCSRRGCALVGTLWWKAQG